jgi:hypothetical protein
MLLGEIWDHESHKAAWRLASAFFFFMSNNPSPSRALTRDHSPQNQTCSSS